MQQLIPGKPYHFLAIVHDHKSNITTDICLHFVECHWSGRCRDELSMQPHTSSIMQFARSASVWSRANILYATRCRIFELRLSGLHGPALGSHSADNAIRSRQINTVQLRTLTLIYDIILAGPNSLRWQQTSEPTRWHHEGKQEHSTLMSAGRQCSLRY